MTAYRFSTEEMSKMIWLEELFVKNGFAIERFPEVYYDTFENACKVFPELEWQCGGNEVLDNPDKLGVYKYPSEGPNILDKTSEGIIILFSDRIADYSRRSRNTEKDIRYIVLMHELGHWLSHWPCADNLRWLYGFQLPNKRTKEALANIIAYWCLETDDHKKVMNDMTPKIINTGEFLHFINKDLLTDDGQYVDTINPYGAYYLLLEKDQKEIIDKIKVLRAAFYLDDQHMFDFLSGDDELSTMLDVDKIEEYVDSAILASVELCDRGGANSIARLFRKNKKYQDFFGGSTMFGRFNLFQKDC